MLAKTCRTVAVLAGSSLALLGIVLFPGLLLLWAVVAAAIGCAVAAGQHVLRPEAGHAVWVGAVVAGGTMALGLAVVGSVVLLGVATVWVVPLLLGLAALIGWRHRRSWTVALTGRVRPKSAAPPAPPRTLRGTPARPDEGEAQRGGLLHSVPPLLAHLPFLSPDAVSTVQLCGAWQRSYWLLLDLPAGPARDEVVRIRRHILDEFERRHPVGFDQWLQTGPRAGSHPGHYLLTGG